MDKVDPRATALRNSKKAVTVFTRTLDQLLVAQIDREALLTQRCNTAGHGRRARIQEDIDAIGERIKAMRQKLIDAYAVMVQP